MPVFRRLVVFGTDSYTSNTWLFTNGLVNYEMKLAKAGISEETQKKVMGETVAS